MQRFSAPPTLNARPRRNPFLASERAGCASVLLTATPRAAHTTRPGINSRTSPPALPPSGVPSASLRPMEAPTDYFIRVFSPEEDPQAAEQCSETIGKGFKTEPNNEFFSGDPSQSAERWRAIGHNAMLRSRGVKLVHSVTLGPEPGRQHAAVALAFSYPEEKAPDDAPEPPGIIQLSGTIRPETVPIREEMLSYLSTKKAAFLQAHGPFEYVAFLATLPEYQGRGLGSRLLRYLTDKADAAGRWCYLEATNPDNVRLYERHSFRQLESRVWTLESLPSARLMLVRMARPPASPASGAAP